MAANEYEPGRWVMLDFYDQPYALVVFVRRGDEVGYRADTWTQVSAERELIGYFRSLRAATAASHQRYLSTRSDAHAHPLEGHRK